MCWFGLVGLFCFFYFLVCLFVFLSFFLLHLSKEADKALRFFDILLEKLKSVRSYVLDRKGKEGGKVMQNYTYFQLFSFLVIFAMFHCVAHLENI